MPRRPDLPQFDIEGALLEVEEAVAGGDQERATSRILDLKDNGNLPQELSKDAIKLQGRYARLRKEHRNRTISPEEHRLETNVLDDDILSWVADVKRCLGPREPREADRGRLPDPEGELGRPSPSNSLVHLRSVSQGYRIPPLHR
jgi:hypothetical protein